MASIFVRQSPIFSPRIRPPRNIENPSLWREIVKTFELQNLAPQILLKTKKAASSSEGRGRFLRPLAVFAAIFLDHPRASRRAASPIGEAVSKGETVIKQTHRGFQFSFRLPHTRSRTATISKALQTRQAFDCKKLCSFLLQITKYSRESQLRHMPD